ncbi:PstS family phosphate ABC transporter substrate-binding protein [Candidatus Nitrosacidococcus tergens]|uniref:Phosphate-binding protein n=1 Tax=Candidatus Nitrosacidococcus tergens TaxID=553981 RepID=A0A7G1Q7S1_9GAMM|nr:phosphate ABC transporter substrate-binding protein PstS family protein [Candidatus Nitrosacidococcus tergens]CAB1274716.1 Phosphate ABC transporter substrate-binding protein, PhoT family [Candidatus Nitrosacidococcus tergens]
MRQSLYLAIGLILYIVLNTNLFAEQIQLDPQLKRYIKSSGITGNLSTIGSDTLAGLMAFWAERFKNYYPSVNVQIQIPGSSAAPPALIENTANLGPMSRKMKGGEISAFKKKYGYDPLPIRVAIDAMAVYVNKDNPIREMTLDQVDAIFSATRKCGYPNNIAYWGEVGLTNKWVTRGIQLFGKSSASGTYGYFKEKALCGGDFKDTINEQPGSGSVVQGISASLNGIGYSGIGYNSIGVHPVALAVHIGAPYIAATSENAITNQYPLARFLYIYVNKPPHQNLPPLEEEFLKMILSKTGQQLVIKGGYTPLNSIIVNQELTKLNTE